jgi:hypothetical protein
MAASGRKRTLDLAVFGASERPVSGKAAIRLRFSRGTIRQYFPAFGHCDPISAGSLVFLLMSPNAMGAVIKAPLKAPELSVHIL